MKKSTVQIVRELVASMVFPLTIKSVVDNTDGTYLLTTGSTHYLQKGSNSLLVIGGNSYEILEVVINQSLLVKGSVLPVASTFNLPPAYFFHGTIKQTNTELSEELDMAKKTPMVYLLRPFDEEVDAMDENDPLIERRPELTLFFLTEANFTDWKTDDFDHEAVEPMWSMANTFIDTVKADAGIDKLTTYRISDKIKFANYNVNGADKILFKDNLSGKELNITLPIRSSCCDIDC